MTTPTEPEALADLKDALESVDIEEGCTIFNHTPEEIGLMVMENRVAMLRALATPARTDDARRPMDEKAIRHDERKKIIGEGCFHTRKAQQQDGDGDRADIRAWQKANSQWFDPTICEIVSEYAAWRDGQPSGDMAAMREAAAKVIDDAVGLLGPKIALHLGAAIRAIPLTPALSPPIIEGDADHWMLAQEVEPAAEEKAGELLTAIRERVAGIIEDCLARHGVDLDKCEGTLDDADEVIAFLSPAAHADVREGLQRAMGIIEKLGGQYDPNGLKFEALSEARAALFDVYSGRPFRSTPPAAPDEGEV